MRRRRLRAQGAAGAVLLVVVGLTVGLVVGTSGGSSEERPHLEAAPASTTTSTTSPLPPAPAVIAATAVEQLQAFAAPDETAEVVATLSALTEYGLPRTLLVVAQQPGWLEALLPIRPNGATGFIRDTDVTLTSTTMAVDISLSRHELVLADAGQPILTTNIVIGKQATPTPLGTFYVTDPVDLQTKPQGFYGAYALGLSGYSEVLKSFRGGPGQIAVHGTPNPDEIGQDISNGCVRVTNEVIVQLASLVPLGTPVRISA